MSYGIAVMVAAEVEVTEEVVVEVSIEVILL
jgi:hypothetical protein